MLRPKRMGKVRVIVLKSRAQALIKDLHEAGLVDIRKSAYEGLDEGRPLASFDQISAELLRLRTAMSIMEPYLQNLRGKTGREEGKDEGDVIPGERAMSEAKKLDTDERLRELSQKATAASESIKALENEAAVMRKLALFKGVDFSRLATRTIDFKAGEVPHARMARLQESLGNSTLVYQDNIALALFSRKDQAAVETALSDSGFSELTVPEGATTPQDTLARMDSDRARNQAELKSAKEGIAAIARSDSKRIATLLRSLEIEAERAEIASRFQGSRFIYIIEGWMLEEDRHKLDQVVAKYGSAVALQDARFGHGEMPPTVLDNPAVASPMEFLTKSYSLPNYFELDPTLAYLVALPIIYGMIVGDVIYGLMSMVIAFLLMKKFEKSYIMYNVSKIWLYSGIPTMVFGIFFDEYAGLSHFKLAQFIGSWLGITILNAPLYTGFHRMESVLALIGLSVLVGMMHLTLGFIFGAINEWHHSKKHSLAKVAWIGVEAGMFLTLLPFMPSLLPELGRIEPALTSVGLVTLVVSVIALAVTEGILGIIEVPGLVGNILSYSRIAAIGVVGVVIAELLNEFMIPSPEHGLLMAIILLPIFFIFHVVNCFIAMFESLIQGGRLNIVEFRSKFMQGGGDVFIPFALYSKKI